MSPKEAVFRVRGLTKVYEMGTVKVRALRGVDLELYEKELIVMIGPSGSGESTLLNILGGLDTATGGRVIYRGRDFTRATEQELTEYRRFHVGFVFQFYNLIPSLTARENVAVVTEIAKRPMRPEDALALVGLSERLDPAPPSSQAASSREWPSRGPSPKTRRSFCATNRPAPWISPLGSWSWRPLSGSTASSAPPPPS